MPAPPCRTTDEEAFAPPPCGAAPLQPRSHPRRTRRAAWWLWPHLLSLDAPLVAVVWQSWWAHSSGVRLLRSDELILGLGVWMIYLADRLGDTTPLATSEPETARHAFYRRQRRAMRLVALAVFIALALLAPSLLPTREFLAGLGLLSLTGVYFWLIHRKPHGVWPRFVPKEAVVGGMFALGTGFFVLLRRGGLKAEFPTALALFGAACFFNCAMITKWERSFQDVRASPSLLNSFPRLVSRLDVGCVVLALLTLAAAASLPHGTVFAPIAISALLLACLDRCAGFLSVDALRLLADVMLLAPWFYLAPSLHGSF